MKEYAFTFGDTASKVFIQHELPSLNDILEGIGEKNTLLVCDENTAHIAEKIAENTTTPLCILPPGEISKNWTSIERILKAGKDAGLARDGLFVGIGGGVISDMVSFAASVYMRGTKVRLVSTSLLGMVDAALGGKTGIDLFDVKNFVGTFYPADRIFVPIAALESLPEREWKSGMAEIIKTAVLDTNTQENQEEESFLSLISSLSSCFNNPSLLLKEKSEQINECITRSLLIKGRIVEADPKETGETRVLLNLGHTFAHALESSAGLGQISHGEAVAWGMARECELGFALGITPLKRKEHILNLLRDFGYEITSPHPLMKNAEDFMDLMKSDKKKKAGKLVFVIPAEKGACLLSEEKTDAQLLMRIIKGA